MLKYFLFSFLTIFILSCGRDSEKERQRAQYIDDSLAKVNEEKRFKQNIEIIKPNTEAPKEAKKSAKSSLLSELPKKWVLLGIYRGQKVVFIPCGSTEAPYFYLSDINSANPKIFFNYAEEQKTYFIARLNQEKGLYKFNLVRYYEEDGGMTSTFDKLALNLQNNGKEMVIEMFVNEPGVTKTRFDMIPEEEMKNYMIVKQQPSECGDAPIQ